MTEHIKKTIEDLNKKIREIEDEAIHMKTTVNQLCGMANIDAMYSLSSLSSNGGTYEIRSDQFHGRPLATVVEEYLKLRRTADQGPASSAEIFMALVDGGYVFDTKSDQNSKISLATSLGKNPKFYKLPNKKWGLKEWYPKAKKRKSTASDDNSDDKAISPQGQDSKENTNDNTIK